MRLAEWDRTNAALKQAEREIRRLRVRMDAIAAGSSLRATAITGVIPAANRPVEWWFNANLLGLGDELELHIGGGVWISGSFAAGRAHYVIGSYCAPPCGGGGGASGTVGWYANGGWFCNALEADLQEEAGVWISGSCGGGRPVYHVGAYPVGAGGGLSGVSIGLEGADFCFAGGLDFHQGAGVWISGSCAAGQADVTVGAYPAASPPTSISGVDVLVKDTEVCFARAVDFHEGTGLWISGSCAGAEATVEFGVYPAAAPPTSISGVDFDLNGADLGYGAGLDIQQRPGVWISGSMSGGRADYQIGAYTDNDPFLSGVSFAARGGALCVGQGIDLREGTGIWISGSCSAGEAQYNIGVKAGNLYSVHDHIFAPNAAPGATVASGTAQGLYHHSGPDGETAVRLYVDAKTAPGASGLPVTVQFGDTDDLDTVSAWTPIVGWTLSSEKSHYNDSMISGTIPANRLLRADWGAIVGTPTDAQALLRVRRPLGTAIP